MRFDVVLAEDSIAADLRVLQERLAREGELDSSDWRPTPACDVSALRRERAGRISVWLKQVPQQRVVGAFTFDTVPSRHHRSALTLLMPHAKLLPPFRGLGLAGWGYRAELFRGHCLMSSARQSLAAGRLWRSLARAFPCGYVRASGRSVQWLQESLEASELAELEVRMLLRPTRMATPAMAGMRTG